MGVTKFIPVRIILLTIALFPLYWSCNYLKYGEVQEKFLFHQGSKDYSIFAGWDISKLVNTGFGRQPAIIYLSNFKGFDQSIPFRYSLHLNDNQDSVVYLEKIFLDRDSVLPLNIIEYSVICEIAIKFLEFNIYSLIVDNDTNVYVKLRAIEQEPMIGKFKNVEKVDTTKWKKIEKSLWFEQITRGVW